MGTKVRAIALAATLGWIFGVLLAHAANSTQMSIFPPSNEGEKINVGYSCTPLRYERGECLPTLEEARGRRYCPKSLCGDNEWYPEDPKPIPEGLMTVMAEGAARAAGRAGFVEARCAQIRDFYDRYGREHTIEIARLKHTDAEIEFWRRTCMPNVRPISR